MKTIILPVSGLILSVTLLSWPAVGQESSEVVPIDGEVRLLGNIADGTPPPPTPPPEPPKLPDFKVEDTVVRHQGGRKVTIHRVEDPDLPLPPPPPEPMSEEELEVLRQSPEYQKFLAEAQERALKTRTGFVVATVYDNEKTQLRWTVPGDREKNLEPRSFEAWSNVSFLHLCGFGAFEYEDIRYDLFMLVSRMDTGKWRELAAEHGVELEIPEGPDLPAERIAYVVTKGDAGDGEGMAVIDGLHALYAKEKDRLVAAYAGRERARKEREAYLEANPPQPKDITIHFWKRKPRSADPVQSDVERGER